MGKPAARLLDMHTCPMVTPGVPPIPHVGGPINGPCVPTVMVGMMPAAVVGDMCICVGPPDTIAMGSPTVLIGNKMAARMGDPTVHGGVIVVGCPTVLIGESGSGGTGGGGGVGGAAAPAKTPEELRAQAAKDVFPGNQSYNNCGLQSARQLIEQARGQCLALSEKEFLDDAIANGNAEKGDNYPKSSGGTFPGDQVEVLERYGVPASRVFFPSKDELAEAIKNKKGVILEIDATPQWKKSEHEINIQGKMPTPAALENGMGCVLQLLRGTARFRSIASVIFNSASLNQGRFLVMARLDYRLRP